MVDLTKTDALDAALKATPAVRAEQVARAKALIQDPAYPSDKVVAQVAGILAKIRDRGVPLEQPGSDPVLGLLIGRATGTGTILDDD